MILEKNGGHPNGGAYSGAARPLARLALVKLLIHLATNWPAATGFSATSSTTSPAAITWPGAMSTSRPFPSPLLWLNRLLFGDSLFALRLLPAVRRCGDRLPGRADGEEAGRRRGSPRSWPPASVIVAPLLLGMNSFFSMNSFDVLFWTLALLPDRSSSRKATIRNTGFSSGSYSGWGC